MQPETSYARLGEDRVAYQVLGDGPPDLVLTMGAFGPVDIQRAAAAAGCAAWRGTGTSAR